MTSSSTTSTGTDAATTRTGANTTRTNSDPTTRTGAGTTRTNSDPTTRAGAGTTGGTGTSRPATGVGYPAGAARAGIRPGADRIPAPRSGGPRPDLVRPWLAERTEALARAGEMAERARHGSGGVLLLTGAAGTGRTALLAAVAAGPAATGLGVLRARCSAEESHSAYAAARQLFNPGARSRGLATRTPGATGRAGPPPPGDPEADLWDLLLLHASHRPLLLAVDDVHLADAPSRQWLHQLCRRIDRLPVLLVVTERRRPELGAPAAGFGRTLTAPLAQTCLLAPLGRAAVADLAGRRLGVARPRGATPGGPPGATAGTQVAGRTTVDGASPDEAPADDTLVDDCVGATGGNPLLLDALLTDLAALPRDRARQTAAGLGPVPAAFADAVDHWLHSSGPEVATAARTLAQLDGGRPAPAAGPAAPPDLADRTDLPEVPPLPAPAGPQPVEPDHQAAVAAELAELTGADPLRLAGWLAGLTAQGLLRPAPDGGRPGFAHPLLRQAVLAGWDAARRAEVHRAAAALLHRRGDPDEQIAQHLLLVPGPGERWASDVLHRAAGAARRGGRQSLAAALLRRALAEPLSTRRRGATLTELGCLEVSLGATGHAAGIRHLAEAVHLQQSDEGVFAAANALGAALAARGETAAALEVLEELADRFADREDLARAVQAAAALISSHDGHSWLQVVEGLRRIAARTPRRIAPAARALLTEFDSTSGLLSAAEVAERVRELTEAPQDPFSQSYVTASAATLAQWADLLPVADRLVEQSMAAYRGPLLHPGYQCLLSVRAESRVMRGEYRQLLDECRAPAREAGTAGPDGDVGHQGLLSLGNAHLVAQAVIALTETGRLDEAHELARSAEAGGAHGSWEWNEYLYARGLLQLASGRPATALADLLECGRRQRERQVESPIVTPWRSAAADCQVLLGLPGQAVELAAEELRLARVWGTPRTVGRAMRALAAATGGRQGLAMAGEAVELLTEAEVATELIPALITFGQLLGGAGRRAAARRTLREAAARAERLGAVRLRTVAVGLLQESGARLTTERHTGAPALTSSEQRICRLAAAGHSNAEIAGLLHLAIRTVETHLTNSFRKLGIRRRAELAAGFEPADPDQE
ncbi:AAA family ATPase [Kitasatospora sp. NBC_00240]|uniref:helix-turn-helix transcriptional regulator n=1 Tax=Kitasatospora sp. NBC_00240 TaxID=2903567 RepID=UPI002256E908|nr:LuxR family transcriptional regulator [Kitasatospora sp. NBC_00240]MCX5213544.1 AAA family ATPase [Kitasatospora sp. NBC_00240]